MSQSPYSVLHMQPSPGSSVSLCATDWGNVLTLCLIFGYKLLCVGTMWEDTATLTFQKVLIYLIVLPMASCSSEDRANSSACRLDLRIRDIERYEYIKEGDIVIGGVLTVGIRGSYTESNVVNCDK